eukprot:TRINITY_DN2044_c0_g1_i1.p1 TRINITY_DN2044_c0_g1~~TRINITY_DN2044_c0_g1_i1.p1  ORF type:complete len:761 (-),score=135.07 TRINITY_DN2044_c0_g1_i1:79-2361(-)
MKRSNEQDLEEEEEGGPNYEEISDEEEEDEDSIENPDSPLVKLDEDIEDIEASKSAELTWTSGSNRAIQSEGERGSTRSWDSITGPQIKKGSSKSKSGSWKRKSEGGSRKRSARRSDSAIIEPPKDIEERHQALNQLGFGFKPFAGHTKKRPLEERSEIVRKLYEKPLPKRESKNDTFISIGNVMYVIMYGWWLSLLYLFAALLMAATIVGMPYAKLCWDLHRYFFWPFGKFIARDMTTVSFVSEETALRPKPSGRVARTDGMSSGRVVLMTILFHIFGAPLLVMGHIWTLCWAWFFVVTIPTAKVHLSALRMIFRKPLEVYVTDSYPGASANVVLFTFQAANKYYYKYSLVGMNILLVNMLPIVIVTLICGYLVPEAIRPSEMVIFFGALISIVPLAYYIGMAVSSISAQSSLGVGALLNASFGSVIELMLYWIAISTGKLGNFVQASVTGSLLCTMLLIPGLSMVAGGIKHKEQRFNQVTAGVSSVSLIMSLVGAFLPTVYYSALGQYTLNCASCASNSLEANGTLTCSHCSYEELDIIKDPAYIHGARPLMYIISGILPIAYIIGLLFTLRTHAAYILEKAPKDAGHGGHDSAEWSKLACVIVLALSTALFAGISDLLSEAVENMTSIGLTQNFLGVFFIGVFGNAAEVINAVNFALRNNIALSIEIGAAGTIQTALIQIPGLVLFSAALRHGNPLGSFILIFPTLDLFAIIFSVLMVNYISINGRTNYFEGTAMLLVYILLMVAFYFVPDSYTPPV